MDCIVICFVIICFSVRERLPNWLYFMYLEGEYQAQGPYWGLRSIYSYNHQSTACTLWYLFCGQYVMRISILYVHLSLRHYHLVWRMWYTCCVCVDEVGLHLSTHTSVIDADNFWCVIYWLVYDHMVVTQRWCALRSNSHFYVELPHYFRAVNKVHLFLCPFQSSGAKA